MRERFIGQIKPEKKIVSYRRGLIAAAVLIPFLFLSIFLWFLADRTGVFSATEYAELKSKEDQEIAVWFNDNVIYPDKVRLNCYYYHHYSFFKDIEMIVATILGRKVKFAEEYV